jgi:ABC-type cobalamin/Fe3+-siderophores transport system ATPase subunit
MHSFGSKLTLKNEDILPVMRLEKIKLSGFKSFVDPTTVHLTSNLIGIVGPNGCGKSNIIDGKLQNKQTT